MSSPKRGKLTRKGTMQQTIEDGAAFIQEGTYDAENTTDTQTTSGGTSTSVLGKRKVNPVSRYEGEPLSPKRSRSKSPARKVAKTASKPQRTRSTSPKKKKTSTTNSTSPKPARKPRAATKPKPITTPIPKAKATPTTIAKPTNTNQSVPIDWEFKSEKPAFGVYVSQGKCWMANDDGDLFGFSLDGKMQNHIKLPSGIKTVVSDMGMWLYAGCDNGVVYDLSREKEPREAYHFKEFNFDEEEELQVDLMDTDTNNLNNENIATESTEKPRHIVFAIDKSSSMSGQLINEVAKNIRMIFDHNLRKGDLISVVNFASSVTKAYSRIEFGTPEGDKLRDYIFSPSFLHCSGCTAFYDALETSWSEFEDRPDEEQWIIALSDGEDNSSKNNDTSICELAKKNRANLICVFVRDYPNRRYETQLSNMCANTPNGLLISASPKQTHVGSVTAAFKSIAQLLSSKIMWMDIRDGLLSVSDCVGRIVACSIEGNPIWQQKSKGTCGWMVRSDFEGVYHGHSQGVTKYSPMDGKLLWHKLDSSRIMFGWMDKTTNQLFCASGSDIIQINCSDGETQHTYSLNSPIISTAASFGSDLIFGSDESGFIYCFEKQGKQLWKLSTGNRGIALSMHFSDDHLFVVTTLGYLISIDVSSDSIKNHLASTTTTKTVQQAVVPDDMQVTLPNQDVKEVKDPGDGVILEVYQEFTDAEVLEISKHIHNPDSNLFTLNGREYAVEKHKNGCKCVNINGLLFIEQNTKKNSKYATQAKNGAKITWVWNQGKWGCVIDDEVKHNGTRLLVRPAANDKGFDTSKTVQFPKNLRKIGQKFVAEQLVLSESGDFYRIQGDLARLVE